MPSWNVSDKVGNVSKLYFCMRWILQKDYKPIYTNLRLTKMEKNQL